jgi:hypothetical protein
MAQSAVRTHDAAPELIPESDAVAWCRAATARKYRVEDGQVWLADGDELAPLPAPVGFASLAAGSQVQVFHALAQFAQYRIGQNVEGKSFAVALANYINGTDVPPAKNNDAFEDAYFERVARAVEASEGTLPADASDVDKKERKEVIEHTARAMRDANFASVIALCKRNGEQPRDSKERKRSATPRTAKTDKAIGGLSLVFHGDHEGSKPHRLEGEKASQ